MNINDLRTQRAALLAQIIENNRRNMDVEEYTIPWTRQSDVELSKAMDALDAQFDAMNPPTKCPDCGELILASREGECRNSPPRRLVKVEP